MFIFSLSSLTRFYSPPLHPKSRTCLSSLPFLFSAGLNRRDEVILKSTKYNRRARKKMGGGKHMEKTYEKILYYILEFLLGSGGTNHGVMGWGLIIGGGTSYIRDVLFI